MSTSYTSLLGLALPVQGELAGTWGDTVNNYITSYLDAAVAGTQTITTDADVTLTKTTNASLGATSSQYAILNCTGARTALRTITAPAASKVYTIINATTGGYSVKLVGAGPTTGVTIVNGESALVAWNGTDFVKISNTSGAGSFTNLTATGSVTFSTATDNLLLGTSQTSGTWTAGGAAQTGTLTLDQSTKTHTLNIGTGATENAATKTINLGTAGISGSTTTINIGSAVSGATNSITVNGNPTFNSGTANGVLYLNASKVATSGSALTFDGTTFRTLSGAVASGGSVNGSFRLDRSDGATNLGAISWVTAGDEFRFDNNNGGFFDWRINTSEQMRLTSTGLGIGTSSPSAKLNVVGTGDMSGIFESTGTTNAASLIVRSGNGTTSGLYAYARFVNNDTNAQDWRIGTYGSNNLSIVNAKAGTTPVVLDSSGNLGLGVTPSAWQTTSYKVLEFPYGVSLFGQTDAASMELATNAYLNSSYQWTYKTSTYATHYRQYQGQHQWFNAASGTAGAAITFTQAMTLDASGNLGVGVTSPAARLDVRSAIGTSVDASQNINAIDTTAYALGNGGGVSFGYVFNSGGSVIARAAVIKGIKENATDGNYATALTFSTTANSASTTEKMRLDSSGNLGLGVTPSASTTSLFQMYNSGVMAWTDNNVAITGNAVYNSAWKYIGTGYATMYKQNVGQHQWHTAASGTAGNTITFTQAMTLDASGNLLVGTTSQLQTANSRLNVAGDFYNANGVSLQTTNGGAGAQFIGFINESGTLIGSINRNAATNAVLYNTTSDQRLKSNVEDAAPVLDKLMQVQVRQYDWTEGNVHQDYGFIAQELEPVLSGVVTRGRAEDDLWQLDYSKLTPHLVKAIQELKAEVDSLKAQLKGA